MDAQISSSLSYNKSCYRKITKRLVPFLFVCYVFAYLDRINIGFAKLQMLDSLRINEAAYGVAAGVFFLGYVLCEIPSNLLMAKVGARRTFSRIMLLWGTVSMCMALVEGHYSLYILRFLLGVFEAGLAPGVVLYLTFWFGPQQLGKVMAIFMSSAALAGAIGGPLSSYIMVSLNGALGLAGWKWMFILLGAPPILLGFLAMFVIFDKPDDASWLSDSEKKMVRANVNERVKSENHFGRSAFTDPRVFAMSACYFGLICGVYAITFWLPSIIQSAGETDTLKIGLYSAIPYLLAVVFMILIGRSSDARKERVRHSAYPALVAAALLGGAIYFNGSFFVSMAAISLATACIYASYSVFWTIPSEYFGKAAAPGGIALVNTIGLLGGWVSPSVIGFIKQSSGSLSLALLTLAATLAIAAVGILVLGSVLRRAAARANMTSQ
ncbi:MFS transporter [Paraburkholderia sp. J63]|uniref:MFS transporter n=1 Tax=Paraburkholderia sp. J63 TaxID=2805434 RepID=UPI002ABE545B|nr:MFS transporter [Paraburkholderia sp. J63]